MNKKILIPIIVIAILAVGISAYFVFQKPASEPQTGKTAFPESQTGKCGDGVCDDFEKANPDLCPGDCKAQPAATTTAATANITVDYSKELGEFSPYLFGGDLKGNNQDNKKGYELAKDVGFKLIQTNTIPPFPSDKDVGDLSKYDFSEMDEGISAIFESGAEPIVFLDSNPSDNKPSDMNVFATYIKAVVTHLKEKKWPNNGRVKVFRFGNEPDNSDYWRGTKQDFFETYDVVAKTLKSVDPSFIINAPGLMNGVEINGSLGPWVKDFLGYCNKNNVPVDLFSTHLYSPFTHHYYKNFGMLRDEIKKYPNLSPIYGTPKLSNDEWNIMVGDLWSGSYHKQFDAAWTASYQTIALINMIEQGLVLSVPMIGTDVGKYGCHDFLLVDCDGNGKPSYYAHKGFSWLINKARLSTTGHDHMNFAAIAGKSDNGIIVVISNYDVKAYLDKYEPLKVGDRENPGWMYYNAYVSQFGQPKVYNKFNLTLNNLPWTSSQKITYERYLVDDSHKLELVESKTLSGSKEMKFSEEIAAPSVQVIKLMVK